MHNNILFIVEDFPPPIGGGNIRIYKFAKYLIRMDWNVFIIYKGPNKNNKIYNDSLLSKELYGAHLYPVNDIKQMINNLYSSNMICDHSKKQNEKSNNQLFSILVKLFKSITSYIILPDNGILLWAPFVLRKARNLVLRERIKYVITSSPPHSTQIIGLCLKIIFKNRIKWLADFRDLWSLSPTYSMRITHNRNINKYIEKIIINCADNFIHVSHSMHNYVLSKLGYDNKFIESKGEVITNGYDNEDFSGLISEKKGILNNNSRILNFCYIGSIMGPRIENKLPEGIVLFNEKKSTIKIFFNFIGNFSQIFMNKCINIKNIQFKKPVSHLKAIEEMQNADALIVILTNDDEGKIAFTGKFFEYLRAKRPILALAPDGEISKIIRENNIGEVAVPDSSKSIADAIERIVDGIKNAKYSFSNINEYIIQYDRALLAVKLANILIDR